MPSIIIRQLTFGFDGAESNLFTDLNLIIDMGWRTCLVGQNGRGKTTLLRLISGQLQPHTGHIECPGATQRFPARIADSGATTIEVAKRLAGPFQQWQQQMDHLLQVGTRDSLQAYGALQVRFQEAGGYAIEAAVERELTALSLSEATWHTPFRQLSGGQQTRVQLASLFLRPDAYPLIDEPTNHLDSVGRALVARYLQGKSGFLLVSHDRAFLDRCVDHVVALKPDSTETVRTSFSHWRELYQRQLAQQAARNQQLKKEIAGFESTAAQRRAGAGKREADKTAHTDKGYIGARAARQMKRALAAEQRARRAAADRRETLQDTEKTYELKLPASVSAATQLMVANNLTVCRDNPLFAPVSFALQAGQRLAIGGANGSGKSSLLQFLCGEGLQHTGTYRCASHIRVVQAWQQPRWRTGALQTQLQAANIDETRFRQVMAALGVRGDVLSQPIETLSMGQQKKLELAISFVTPADVLVWDEPLNYLDIDTRERIEVMLLQSAATLVFCEHDAVFEQRIATQKVVLRAAGTAGADHASV